MNEYMYLYTMHALCKQKEHPTLLYYASTLDVALGVMH